MLSDAKVVAFLSTSDAGRAKAFYRDRLGLTLVEENGFALVFDVGGTMLRCQIVREVIVAPYTALGWRVEDIHATVKWLQGVGVAMLRVEGLPQDEDGVWRPGPNAAVAWFKDPEGHTLSVTQFPV